MTATDMMKPQDAALTGAVLESLVTRGDISGLPPQARAKHYAQLCERVGLDPATTPFQPMKLQGKEILYATKGAAEQLRSLHKISITITSRERIEDVYYVTARAMTPDNRTDESQGAVAIGGLKGDALANAIMKAETKAKRRVTLSIVGLGMLDESELETIPADRFAPIAREQPAATVVQMPKTEPVVESKAKQSANPNKPPKWTSKEALPDLILKACPALRQLQNIPIDRMGEDDLDLVVEQGKQAYTRWAGVSGTSPKALALLQEIIMSAEARVSAHRGSAPPPGDDDGPPTEDYGNEDGEVRS